MAFRDSSGLLFAEKEKAFSLTRETDYDIVKNSLENSLETYRTLISDADKFKMWPINVGLQETDFFPLLYLRIGESTKMLGNQIPLLARKNHLPITTLLYRAIEEVRTEKRYFHVWMDFN
jgi:hypothetical protein